MLCCCQCRRYLIIQTNRRAYTKTHNLCIGRHEFSCLYKFIVNFRRTGSYMYLLPSMVLKVFDVILNKCGVCVGSRKQGKDAGVIWRIWCVNIQVLKSELKCATTLITSHLQPDLILGNGPIMPRHTMNPE